MTAALPGQPTLVDTGPLVAWLDRSDQDHLLCARYFASATGPLISTWPVATEVCHLVPAQVAPRFLEWIQLGGLQLAEIPTAALLSIAPWMKQYEDLPLDLAGASLLWVAQQTGIRAIATLDRRDFAGYHLPGGDPLINVLEPQL
ncbi:type II toxin-antitoxin system VapC family toxin [Cyanobium sp. CH-040]|uniref:type II toxin-antitoxin system VapC family toxin n=1 Tax=Cyanobium sp. CH-040 TaxID=2823708 RepID=UPI0020CCE091|nr:PIN domain-containing protein [Cyanobium sp. CH-040]MCP9927872.1 PIN domain-containing protein [Cyanobium sp. CH-040]